jgi:hypothetical protein
MVQEANGMAKEFARNDRGLGKSSRDGARTPQRAKTLLSLGEKLPKLEEASVWIALKIMFGKLRQPIKLGAMLFEKTEICTCCKQ